MKKAFLIGLVFVWFVPSIKANDNIEHNLFVETFEGMFDSEPIYFDSSIQDNPPPPVPLDGGLTALLLAGSVAGYRQYRKKRKGML